MQYLLSDLSINVTEMFRDPEFFKKVRSEVAPILQTYPRVNIWHAGCATGEEVYSMAILLHEEDLLRRSQLYATDFNNMVLRKAKEGVYPISAIKEYTANYQKSGGKASFSDYYTARYNSVLIHSLLKHNLVFAMHNLALDGPFAEAHMIVCRNVLIYFNRVLQNKVIGTFTESLLPGGILCLGSKEDLQFSDHYRFFSTVDPVHKIYRKKYDITY
ncbi:MAG TPA: CheR family methyltransferase [Bacteroidales bacterium]|nr:CheR family methyltransferase [Bacteroidales bacterium]